MAETFSRDGRRRHHSAAPILLKPGLQKDVWGGLLMVAIGGGVTWQAAQYRIGTLRAMGPGYFPLALGVILIGAGIVITANACLAYRSMAEARADTPRRAPQWKAWGLISFSIVAFVVAAEYLGLVPAAFAVVFIAAIGDHGNSWKASALLALGIVAIAVVVFWWGLQVQLPLFRWRAV